MNLSFSQGHDHSGHKHTHFSHRRDYRSVARPAGSVVVGLGIATCACAIVGGIFESIAPEKKHLKLLPVETIGLLSQTDKALGRGVGALLFAALITLALGAALLFYGRKYRKENFSRQEAIFTVAIIWLSAGICGALPFVVAAGLSPSAAFFESISGLTTTGATVITDIEGSLSRPILLWRSLLQWLGGMGIVVLFVAVFPNVGAGGKHMFTAEVPGTTAEGLKPRIAETSFMLWRIYTAFTILEALVLFGLGMTPFEAICHALTTMSTGGFSTRDASVAAFNSSSIEYVISIFMLIASVNFGLYYGALRTGSLRVIWKSLEFRIFLIVVTLSTIALTVGIRGNHNNNLIEAFRYAFFMVSTIVSSTGYGTDDYTVYPSIALGLVVALMFLGGCAGSTAGGIKIERGMLLAKLSRMQVKQSFRPNVVHIVRLGRKVVEPQILGNVATFFVLYMCSLSGGVLVIALVENVGLDQAFGAMLTCLSNMGPAPFHVGGDHFASYSPAAQLVFAFFMVLGRLEFFTLLALFTPSFWKR